MKSLKDKLAVNGYEVVENDLFKLKEVKGETEYKKISNFVPYIVSENKYLDGCTVKSVYKLKGVYTDGTVLPEISVLSTEFESLNWIKEKWGMKCIISTDTYGAKEYLKEAIQSTASIDVKHIYNHLGLLKYNNNWIYIHGNGAIGSNSISTELDTTLNTYSLNTRSNNFISSLELIESELVPSEIILPLVASVYLSPLNEFLKMGGYEPKVLLYLHGRTGAMKSTLASLILSHFGKFNNTNLPMSFRDTAHSIVRKSFLLKDTLTVIDDFHPSSYSEEKTMTNTVQSIARAYGDRVGRTRLTTSGELLPSYPPRGNAIITGESLASIGESGTSRYLSVELKKNDVSKELLTEYQCKASKGEFISSTKNYIQYILSQVNKNEKKFITSLQNKFTQNRNKFNELLASYNPHGRIVESVAWLMIGIDMYYESLWKQKLITKKKYNALCDESIDVFKNVAIEQCNLVKVDNPVKIFIEKFTSLYESKRINVVDLRVMRNIDNYTNISGFEDNEYYYLTADVVIGEVKKMCREQGEVFTITKKSLLKELANEDYIRFEDNKNTFSKNIYGKARKLIWLRKEKVL